MDKNWYVRVSANFYNAGNRYCLFVGGWFLVHKTSCNFEPLQPDSPVVSHLNFSVLLHFLSSSSFFEVVFIFKAVFLFEADFIFMTVFIFEVVLFCGCHNKPSKNTLLENLGAKHTSRGEYLYQSIRILEKKTVNT